MYEIMQRGAKGVKMGTRFVTTNECDASEKFKQTYIDAKEEDIKVNFYDYIGRFVATDLKLRRI